MANHYVEGLRDTFSSDELHLDQGAFWDTLGSGRLHLLSGLMDLQGLRVAPVEFKGLKDAPSHTLVQWALQLMSRIAEAVASVVKPPEVEALGAMIRNPECQILRSGASSAFCRVACKAWPRQRRFPCPDAESSQHGSLRSQPAGEVESRASASTAPRTAECGFTRMTPPGEYTPTPTVRIVETPYEGLFFCTPSPQGKIHIDTHCWGLRNVPHPQQRSVYTNCVARLGAQTR